MDRPAPIFTPILIGGCIIVIVSFGARAGFGLFQIPVSETFGWPRADFSMAIAIQNLAWGIGQPIFGAIAEKLGDRKAILMGIVLYALGLFASAFAVSPGAHQMLNLMIGFGIAGSGFGVILAMVGRASSDKNRSISLAIATAAGSAGQVLVPPFTENLIGAVGWQTTFMILAACVAASTLLLPMMKTQPMASKSELEMSMGRTLITAFRDPSYVMIFLGFFSCGYQLGFITAHFPAFVTELCGPISPGSMLDSIGISDTSKLGAISLSLIGMANIAGTLLAGWAGNHFTKKYLLAIIYTLRTVVAAAFILLPITPLTVILFSVSMGSLWLATVPLTSGLVGYIYGLRYMATLYGFVFFSHQLGGFLGVWLGGRMYDIYGDYTAVWWIGVGVGAFSALVHLPIKEKPNAGLVAA